MRLLLNKITKKIIRKTNSRSSIKALNRIKLKIIQMLKYKEI